MCKKKLISCLGLQISIYYFKYFSTEFGRQAVRAAYSKGSAYEPFSI